MHETEQFTIKAKIVKYSSFVKLWIYFYFLGVLPLLPVDSISRPHSGKPKPKEDTD
jgi:hypothetical protein